MESAHIQDEPQQADSFLSGGGEMGALMRSLDWSQTPLGPIENWPQSLRSAVSILLASRAQIILFWGPDLAALYNDSYVPTFGSKHPWALGKPARECWAELWDDTLRSLFEGVLRSGESFYADEHPFFLERHGYIEETYYDVSYDPVRAESGAVGGIFCIVSDATGRVLERRRWQTLRELAVRSLSEARSDKEACQVAAETIGGNNRDVPFALIYLIDADRKMARLAAAAGIETGTPNSPLEAPLGVAAGEGVWLLDEVASQNRPKLIDSTKVAGLPCGAWDEPPRSVLVLPLAAPGQDLPTGLLVAAVSPRRLLDDVYQNFYHTMAGHISTSITHARAYAEERHRAEALAEIDRAKTVFFSNVSHEFRTPLTLMLGPMEDLLARPADALPAEEREQLDVMHRNCMRLLKLVNTLLDFSRIEAGRIQAAYEPTDLAALTADLTSLFRSAIERVGLELILDCPPLPEPVYVDREMWEKIVSNLLSNALKFTFEGAITVSLSMADGHVELRVRDTGTGIAEADLPRIFERFHRIRGAEARTHEGTGIGLALVQELARLHGGSVCVESEVGAGTTFTVSIPTGSAHLPADRVRAERSVSNTSVGARAYVEEALRWVPEVSEAARVEVGELARESQPGVSFSARILLADDNADMREYVKRILGQHWTVEAVSDGNAALNAARERTPDLVLTDVMMPGLDGLELLRELRADPLTREVPVILLSARADEESRVEGMETGADDYLTKPFTARELVARVGPHIQIARIRREANEALRESERKLLVQLSAMARMQQVSTRLVQAGDFSTLLHDILDAAIEISGADKGNVQFFEEEGLKIVAQRGFEAPFLDFFNTVHKGQAACGAAIERGERVIVEDVANSDLFTGTPAPDIMLDAGARAVQSTPLLSRSGRMLGMFSTHYHTPRRLSEPELHQLDVLARQAADLIERMQAEEARARLASIVESSDDAIISKDLSGIITSWNRGAEKIFGYTAVEAIGKPITMLIPSHLADEERQILERLGRGEMIDHFETTRQRKDGTAIDISLSISPIRDEAGNITGMSKIARDITERKRAEQALRQSEERYRSLTGILTSIVWTTDTEGAFVAPQPEWEAFTGQTWEEHKGWGWTNAFHPDDRERVQDLWRQALATRSRYESEGRLWHAPSADYHHFVARGVPLFNEDGSVREWIGNVLDVQERKEAEEERERLLAAERKAREAASAASRAKDEFLATLSHELRTPLNAILGWARLLSSGGLDDETAARGLKAIERNSTAQAQLIEDLLDVSRIISGKFRLSLEPIYLVRVVEAAIDSIRPTAEAKGVRLQTMLDPDAGPISGDAGRLQQVIWNLLSNAVKFTPKGGRVQVRLTRINSHIEIEVSDTGQGIESEFLPYVFDRFQQADGSTTRKHGGLGLGLAIVRHITELHGGIVSAYSPGEGRGAAFTVRLPIMAIHTRHSDKERVHPQVNSESALYFKPSLDLEGVRVLVVDDEPDTTQLLSTVLTQCGAYVKTAASAKEAFATLKEWRPNLIVSDIGMPEEDGYSFMKRVRTWARETGIWVPAVALTAYARAEDRLKALDSGYQMHLPKPVEPLELVKVLVSLVERPTTLWKDAL
jgi:PAS domain S-box-containing protein